MPLKLEKNILEALSRTIQQKENNDRAVDYLYTTRKVTFTTGNKPYLTADLNKISKLYSFKNDWLSDSLYFPIYNLHNNLIAYDVRYIGKDTNRPRYYKLTTKEIDKLIYNISDILYHNKILIVAEGVIDLENIKMIVESSSRTKISYISPLTCLSTSTFIDFCLACSNKVIFAYDNDSAGTLAKNRIREYVKGTDFEDQIKFITYLAKDINECYVEFGSQTIIDSLKNAIMF